MKKLVRGTTPETWPKPVEEAAQIIVENLEGEDEQYLRELKRDDMIQLHFSLGMMIRNSFGLWKDNDVLLKDCYRTQQGLDELPEDDLLQPLVFILEADTASSIILNRVWEILQEKKPQ